MDYHPASGDAHKTSSAPKNKPDVAHACRPVTVTTPRTTSALEAFMGLHLHVIANLPPEKKHFVKKRDLHDLFAHVAAGHHVIAVNSVQQQMVAQALMTLPERHAARNLEGYPFGPDIMPEDSIAIQAVGVHKDHRGCDLPAALLQKADDVAEAEGRTHIIAKMDAGNKSSKDAFLAAGYKPHGEPAKVGTETYFSLFMVKSLPKADKQSPRIV